MATDAHEPGLDMTAAELALGLLDGEERAAALRRVLAEPAFACEVEDWRHRLAGLFDDYTEVEAPESVAGRLAAPVRQSRKSWPFITMLTALAAAFAFFLVVKPQPSPVTPHQVMVASLLFSDKTAAVPAVVDLTTGEMRIGETAVAPGGKSAQLWMIGADGVPQPMGVLAATGPSRIALPTDTRARLAAGITLAISIEPDGGSPTGKPTGPVVASGKLSVA
ncbi:anti-sigma factor [uncultured Sphingomonas sp.]|uniref:anti-sigma factor n=1 Tax=uncultured Sphingomonas sp. TaxID=158754 RepID=UPI00262EAAC4|nr:anti-sigma factor [uncultured Sphingomonas sp.]